MPYEVVHIGKKFAVKTTSGPNKGKLHGFTTEKKAHSQERLLSMMMGKKKEKM
jgi:hypothetical protein